MSRRQSRLNALFDTPSSPLAPPPSSDTVVGALNGGTTPLGSPSNNPVTPTNSARRSHSSSPYAPALSARRSRGSRGTLVITEDFSQHGALVAGKLRLKPEGVKRLEDFVKVILFFFGAHISDVPPVSVEPI